MSSQGIDSAKVEEHYDRVGIVDRLSQALREAGMADRVLTPEELAPLDQFHSLGFPHTVDLAGRLNLTPETRVLDVGSGIGGPSRYIAKTFGSEVTGIDLTPTYVETATYLTELAGLTDRVRFRQANALAIPFEDESFDVVWTQHVAMNISDRAKFYREIFRVLRPGGTLAEFDVIAGPNGPYEFPAPWSRHPETSFLLSEAEMRMALETRGFRIESWIDLTQQGVEWFRMMKSRFASGVPTLGLHLFLGEDFPELASNLGRNVENGRAGLLEVIAVRPS